MSTFCDTAEVYVFHIDLFNLVDGFKKMIPEHGMMIPVCFVWLGFDRWLRTTKQMIVSVDGPAVYLLYPTGKRWKRPTNSNDSSSWQKIKITRSSVKSVQCCLWISDFFNFFTHVSSPKTASDHVRGAQECLKPQELDVDDLSGGWRLTLLRWCPKPEEKWWKMWS